MEPENLEPQLFYERLFGEREELCAVVLTAARGDDAGAGFPAWGEASQIEDLKRQVCRMKKSAGAMVEGGL